MGCCQRGLPVVTVGPRRHSTQGTIPIPIPVPIPIFSCFQLERAGIVAWLLGLAGGAVTRFGARVEIGRVMGLGGEVVCGGRNDGVGLGLMREGVAVV
jgi:hypothetical protein